MAQLAEQLICNQQVIGSSPIIGFVLRNQYNIVQLNMRYFGWIPEWPKGTDCKSAGTAFGGSNPPSPIKMQVDKLSSGIYTKYVSAGWSSLEARRAHNPKVVGSNPAPAIFYA